MELFHFLEGVNEAFDEMFSSVMGDVFTGKTSEGSKSEPRETKNANGSEDRDGTKSGDNDVKTKRSSGAGHNTVDTSASNAGTNVTVHLKHTFDRWEPKPKSGKQPKSEEAEEKEES